MKANHTQVKNGDSHFERYSENEIKYLKLLAQHYPNILSAKTEAFLLKSELNNYKKSEIFLSDLHGEYEAFQHMLRNGSGLIKQKVKHHFDTQLSPKEINRLCTLIYYPEEKIALLLKEHTDLDAFFKESIPQLIILIKDLSVKYSERTLIDLYPSDYRSVLSELLSINQSAGLDHAIQTFLEDDWADSLICILSELIRKLAIDQIHIIGDVYDRGPAAEKVMDELYDHHAVDVQWGNHDIVWMGAACGSEACMANVLRLSLRYGNTDTLEKGYGVHLMPLASFALEYYGEDKSLVFDPKFTDVTPLNASERMLNRLMHKAISIIQFKLEGQLIERNPSYHLKDRLLLDKIDLTKNKLVLDGKEYVLNDDFFPTLDTNDPYRLTKEEEDLIKLLKDSFLGNKRLQRHVQFLFTVGGMYKVVDNNLLYHGCIPLDKNGDFLEVEMEGEMLHGKSLMDFFDKKVRNAVEKSASHDEKRQALDLMWYLWSGPYSPIFGKSKMATFERYFLDDAGLKEEKKNAYYEYRDSVTVCNKILREFGLNSEKAMILNGHVPVSVKEGESPVKAGGKLIVIDGGLSKAYQGETGIGGFTLIQNRFGCQLMAQEPFESRQKAIEDEMDIAYSKELLTQNDDEQKMYATDEGKQLTRLVGDLEKLIDCYDKKLLTER